MAQKQDDSDLVWINPKVQTSLESIFFLFEKQKKQKTVLGGYLDLATFRLVWKTFSFCLKIKRNKQNVFGGYLDLAMFRLVWKTFSFCFQTTKKLFWGATWIQPCSENIFFLFEKQQKQKTMFWGATWIFRLVWIFFFVFVCGFNQCN